MTKLPVLKPRSRRSARKARIPRDSAAGNPQTVRHADGRGTTVPFHQGRDISPILLRQIARDIGMAAETFIALEL